MLTPKEITEMYPKRGSFTLAEGRRKFPLSDDKIMISIKGFNAIEVRGTVHNALLRIHHITSVDLNHSINKIIGTNKINETIPFPLMDNSGFITFESEAEDKNTPIYSIDLKFQLLNITCEEYNRLAKRDW